MPTYPYSCLDCHHQFEVTKRVAEIDADEACPECGGGTNRTISTQQTFYGANDWNHQTFDPVFGQVVRGNLHRKQLAKERGWIEIGDEPVSKVHKHYEDQRSREREQAWDKL